MAGITFFLESVFLQLKQKEHVLPDHIFLIVIQIHKVTSSAIISSNHTLVHGTYNMQSSARSSA